MNENLKQIFIDNGLEYITWSPKRFEKISSTIQAHYASKDKGLQRSIESLQMVYEEIKSQKWGKIKICDRAALQISCTLDRLKQLQSHYNARRLSEEEIDKIAEDYFRSYYVPLYPKDKPIFEMTSYEQGLYKSISLDTRRVSCKIFKAQEDKLK